jgi:hypothetical protein
MRPKTGHSASELAPKRFAPCTPAARTGRAAIVVDDLESIDPWHPRAVEVRGRAEAIAEPQPVIRIYPERIVSWGLEPRRSARTVRQDGASRESSP